jgi:tetratricopeptide (TPR) repeat protein
MVRGLGVSILLVALAAAAQATHSPAHQLLIAGHVDEAVRALKTQINSSPADADSYNLLCRANYALRRWDDAISACERAVALEPNNSAFHMWLGRAYGEKADSSSWLTAISLAKKVRSEFERAVELDGKSLEARSDLAEFYVEAPGFLGGGKDKARAQADRIAALDTASAHWVRALIAEKDNNYELAVREYNAAIQSSGNDATYWLNLASFYRRIGRLNDMEGVINSAVASQKRSPAALFDAAAILLRAGRNFPGAVRFMRSYISASDPAEDAPIFQAHFLLGSLLEKLGDKPGAAAEYRASLSLASNFSQAQQALKRVD